MSLNGMIKSMEKLLGLGEPNYVQRWYAGRNGSAFNYNFPWCDAAITWAAVQAGEHQAVCFGTDYAYTVAHASRFQKAGRWRSGTAGIRRGDIVFFDWGGSRSISRIDHVGIVTSVSGGKIYTIEGNTSDRCLRRTRTAGVIAGYGRPAYGSSGGGSGGGGSSSGALTVDGQLGPLTARATQRALGVDDDGIWGPVTVRAMQRRSGAGVDGILGPVTTRAVQRRVGAVVDGVWPSIARVSGSGLVTFNMSATSETTSKLQTALNGGKF